MQLAQLTFAQGAGWAGVGLLADLAGNDAYHVANHRMGGGWSFPCACSGLNATHTGAQGYASFWAGLGVLLDAGGGDDTYAVEARPEWMVDDDNQLQGSSPHVWAFGAGVYFGAALWADDGGRDQGTLSASSITSIPPDDPREQNQIPNVRVWGVGAGTNAGAGVVLAGPGPTSWRITTAAAGPYLASPSAHGFAQATIGGYAAVHDEGGDDSYVIESSGRAEKHVSVDEDCDCLRARSVAGAGASVIANTAQTGGVALLQDLGGNDRYLATATAEAVASATDTRQTPGQVDPGSEEEPRCATSLAWEFDHRVAGSFDHPCHGAVADALASATARGWAFGWGGASFLIDAEGDDIYRLDTDSVARADAQAAHPDTPREGHAVSFRADSVGQAASGLGGYAELRDGGGDDSYLSSNTRSASAMPPTEEGFGLEPFAYVQAAPDLGPSAVLIDAGPGEEDVFASSPHRPPCQGTRGQGVWVDRGPAPDRVGVGVGMNL